MRLEQITASGDCYYGRLRKFKPVCWRIVLDPPNMVSYCAQKHPISSPSLSTYPWKIKDSEIWNSIFVVFDADHHPALEEAQLILPRRNTSLVTYAMSTADWTWSLIDIDDMTNKTMFSKVDLMMTFHEISVAEEEIPNTALTIPIWWYALTMMIFRLRNTVSNFM